MTSDHIGDRAAAFVAGELPDADSAAIERHLAVCTSCRAEVDAVALALAAVSAWPKQPTLPSSFGERLIRSATSGRVTAALGRGRRWWKSPVAAAVLLSAFSGAIGFGAGRMTRGAVANDTTAAAAGTDSTMRSYMLLLEEPVWPPRQPLSRAGYGAWSRAIAAESRFGGAEKLTEEPGFRVGASGAATRPAPTEPNFSGWYIVRARSYDEAISWARRGPHLAYGSVLVREIEP